MNHQSSSSSTTATTNNNNNTTKSRSRFSSSDRSYSQRSSERDHQDDSHHNRSKATYPSGASSSSSQHRRKQQIDIKLFVGQVPRSWEENDLKVFFEKFGEILKVQVLRDKNGVHKGCAFIVFASILSANDAIENLKTYKLPGMHNPVQIKWADNEIDRLGIRQDQEHILYVAQIPRNASEGEIREVFSKYGRVKEVDIPLDTQGCQRGYVFVKFQNIEESIIAKQSLHDTSPFHDKQLPLIIRFYDPKKKNGTAPSSFNPSQAPYGSSTSGSGSGSSSHGYRRDSDYPSTSISSQSNRDRRSRSRDRSTAHGGSSSYSSSHTSASYRDDAQYDNYRSRDNGHYQKSGWSDRNYQGGDSYNRGYNNSSTSNDSYYKDTQQKYGTHPPPAYGSVPPHSSHQNPRDSHYPPSNSDQYPRRVDSPGRRFPSGQGNNGYYPPPSNGGPVPGNPYPSSATVPPQSGASSYPPPNGAARPQHYPNQYPDYRPYGGNTQKYVPPQGGGYPIDQAPPNTSSNAPPSSYPPYSGNPAAAVAPGSANYPAESRPADLQIPPQAQQQQQGKVYYKYFTADKVPYYYDPVTQETQYDLPPLGSQVYTPNVNNSAESSGQTAAHS